MAAPAFPLSSLGAPGGATVADVLAQAGDVTCVIDSFLAFASDAQNRFASGVDAERIGLTGHSGGALTTLVTTYDANGGATKPQLVITSWEGYKTAGPLLFSTDHRGTADGAPVRVSFSNAAVKLVGSDSWIDAR